MLWYNWAISHTLVSIGLDILTKRKIATRMYHYTKTPTASSSAIWSRTRLYASMKTLVSYELKWYKDATLLRRLFLAVENWFLELTLMAAATVPADPWYAWVTRATWRIRELDVYLEECFVNFQLFILLEILAYGVHRITCDFDRSEKFLKLWSCSHNLDKSI